MTPFSNPPIRIDFWYGNEQWVGRRGLPQRWANVLGRVTSDCPIHLVRWKRESGDEFLPLCLGPTAYRLHAPGDFNIELDTDTLQEGANRLVVQAMDVRGRTAEESLTLHYLPHRNLLFPHRVDWSACHRIDDAAQVVDGRWMLTAGGARATDRAYDRAIALGDRNWTDYQVTTTLTLHRFDRENPLAFAHPSVHCWAGLVLRWQGHHDWHDMYPRRGWHPFGAIIGCEIRQPEHTPRWSLFGNRMRLIAHDEGQQSVAPDTPYHLKALVQTRSDGISHYRAKVWTVGESEPDTWLLEGPGAWSELKRGSVLLVAHHTEAIFGPVTVETLP
ncbi:MAG: hypothetical protein OHK0029_16490 [Armatimonadaceae bacterium]